MAGTDVCDSGVCWSGILVVLVFWCRVQGGNDIKSIFWWCENDKNKDTTIELSSMKS